MAFIQNPILQGFNPDPSFLRVGDDYYIATSTFEWFPGVQIHHSKDLVHWELIAHPLERTSQLDMLGEDDSCGVWAPCLTYDKGTFYLIYTDAKSFVGMFKDTYNYLVTAKDIRGPWSEPIYLNKSGFDPSLFHDDDGRKYLVNMAMDYRSYQSKFGGIFLQEYSEEEKKLVGPRINIFKGTPSGITEGPHLYKHDGYYYLMTAEGGTEYRHAVTVARSRSITGPYEPDPAGHMLTTKHLAGYPLQKSGHGSLVEAANGRWYLTHLCSRPLGTRRVCVLGRETALQEVVWKDGWLRLADGTNRPALTVEIPDAKGSQYSNDLREDFDGNTWSIHLQSLRAPLGELASLTERKGWLRLHGAESPNSKYRQAHLAHRQQSFTCEVTTKMEFHPEHFQHLAGLTYYYNTMCYYYLYVTRDEMLGKVLSVIRCDLREGTHPIGAGVQIPEDGAVYLRLTTHGETANFSYSVDGENYTQVGPELDALLVSDDYFNKTGHNMFTGAFAGICCQDLAGDGCYADFDFVEYRELS
ncbi:MAG: glycoside hydrolase family 43 protein [Lachnospiraceae bacterium]|nr:glycoside hydrolase family 43 protein [Lachnospiraceae bacterium]